jgi:hypothetical protein
MEPRQVSQRDERIGRPVPHRPQGTQCLIDGLKRRVAGLERVAGQPSTGGSVVSPGFGIREQSADRSGVGEGDAGQLGGGVADQVQVSKGERAAEAGVCMTLCRHERMFALWSSLGMRRQQKPSITPMVRTVSFLVCAVRLG